MIPEVWDGADEIEYLHGWAVSPCWEIIPVDHYTGTVQNTSGDACSKIVRHRQAIIPDLILLTCFDDYSCASQGSVLNIMGPACDYQFLKACQLSSRRSPRIESTARSR